MPLFSLLTSLRATSTAAAVSCAKIDIDGLLEDSLDSYEGTYRPATARQKPIKQLTAAQITSSCFGTCMQPVQWFRYQACTKSFHCIKFPLLPHQAVLTLLLWCCAVQGMKLMVLQAPPKRPLASWKLPNFLLSLLTSQMSRPKVCVATAQAVPGTSIRACITSRAFVSANTAQVSKGNSFQADTSLSKVTNTAIACCCSALCLVYCLSHPHLQVAPKLRGGIYLSDPHSRSWCPPKISQSLWQRWLQPWSCRTEWPSQVQASPPQVRVGCGCAACRQLRHQLQVLCCSTNCAHA